jgi:cell division protein FtsQ
MSGARVRRGSSTRAKPRKSGTRGPVTKKLAARLPVSQKSANKLANWTLGAFVAAILVVTAVALELPSKAWTAAGEQMGNAGFRVRSVDIKGIKNMDSRPVFELAVGEKQTAMPLLDIDGIREKLLRYGWVKDARVSRRLPDTLVIDIVEREPTAIWQDREKLSLIDGEGVVLGKVKLSELPDLPLLVGAGANAHSRQLDALLATAPNLRPQMESAEWVGGRRWDLKFQTGETVTLPEGEKDATTALAKFAKLDKSAGLLGRGILRFDLRVPGKMIVRLPQVPGEPDQPAA